MRYEIALRILGDELNPEEVTDLLEIIPDYKAKKGEKRGNLSTKYTIGVWAKIFEEDSKDFLGSLLFHAKQMEKYEKEFKMLCDAGNRVQFYCGVWYEEEIEKEMGLEKNAKNIEDSLGIQIVIDSYDMFY